MFLFVCRCCVFLFRVWCSLYDVEKASVSSFCWWVDEKSWKSLPSGIRSTCIKMKGRPKPSSNLAWMFLLYLVFPLQNLHKNLDAFWSFVAKKTRFRPRVNRRFETQDRLGVLHETSICKKNTTMLSKTRDMRPRTSPCWLVPCSKSRTFGRCMVSLWRWRNNANFHVGSPFWNTFLGCSWKSTIFCFAFKKKTLNCVSNRGSFLSIE